MVSQGLAAVFPTCIWQLYVLTGKLTSVDWTCMH